MKKKDEPDLISKANDIALKAIDKEMDIEQLLEKEELQRERDMEQQVEQQINNEKKKEECIDKAIKERELENQYNVRTKGQADEIDNIKTEAKRQISIRRSELKKKLENYRRRSRERLESKKAEIQNVRVEIADKLSKAYRKGDCSKCETALSNDLEWKSFCKAQFSVDYIDAKSCENEDQRCNYCVDIEFGNLDIDEKERCMESLCKRQKRKQLIIDGKWIWEVSSENLEHKAMLRK